jgi:CheY-like chemotaxis protein
MEGVIRTTNRITRRRTPMAYEAQEPTQASNQPAARVLVIDDEAHLIELISLGLKYEGFEVEAAATGEEGIAAAQRRQPVAIILDWMLPDLDGLEVCRRLRSNPTTRELPILLLTAKGEVGSRVAGLNTGADDYLTGCVPCCAGCSNAAARSRRGCCRWATSSSTQPPTKSRVPGSWSS